MARPHSHWIRFLPLFLLAALSASCQPADQADPPQDMEEDTVTSQQSMTRAVQSPPEPTAEGMWNHLTSEDYAGTWDRWPGTEELYEGRDPHGMLLTTYVNEVARQAVTNRTDPVPAGAVIVKENYMPDSTLNAVTVMYKAEGYDRVAGDWYWMKRLSDGVVEAEGRVEGCQDCHARSDWDYLRTEAQPGGP